MSFVIHEPVQRTTLRRRLLDGYMSTSAGLHRRITDASFEPFCRAHRYHLRGWMPRSGCRWLDVGCGQGALMHLAREVATELVGVDASAEMVAACRARGFIVEHADLWEYLARTPDARWDAVSAFDLLEHFSNDDGVRLLEEIRRVLAPGGVCLLKLPNAVSPWGASVFASDLTHEAAYTPLSLAQLAALAGFRRCEVREVGPAPVSPAAALRWVLWRGVRLVYAAVNRIEGGAAHGGVYTQVMTARLT